MVVLITCFIQVYHVASVGSKDTIKISESFALIFGISQKTNYDSSLGFMSENSAGWTYTRLALTHDSRTSHLS